MTLTGAEARILQIHPTRFCNLRCVHCYSSSGPQERDALNVPLLRHAIPDAAQLGYNVLSISGGEPLLYSGLAALCREGREHGMLVTLVTNGTTLTQKLVADLQGVVSAIAISLDGVPERHNRSRRSSTAFESMEKRLELVRRWGIPFGFVFTLTRENLAELEWAADFAVAQGASLLQVHLIEESGRALSAVGMTSLTEEETGIAWVIVECLRDIHKGKLTVQLDSLNRYALPPTSEITAHKAAFESGECRFGEVISPLVIEDDGSVVPLRYGFPRSFALGNLHEGKLDAMAAAWAANRFGAFCDVYREALEKFAASNDRFGNIYQMLAEEAADQVPELVCIR